MRTCAERWAVTATVTAALAACATAPAPAAASGAGAAPPAAPLPRSSIAAVIQRRAELGLSDEQVRDLELIDHKRETADASIREDLASQERAARTPAAGSKAAGGAGAGMPGGMRGGGMRGHGPRPPQPAAGPSRADREVAAQQRLDDDDTKAYLDAEQVLTPAQRDQAREIASDYRAQLYDRRHGAGGSAAGTK